MKCKQSGMFRMPAVNGAWLLATVSALTLIPGAFAQQTSGQIEEIVVQGTATGTGFEYFP